MSSFASDNYAPAHPAVLKAVVDANVGPSPAYGADPWTTEAKRRLREHFGAGTQVYLTFNGTGANVLGLQSMVTSWQSVLCARTAHINVDEAGAPEKLLGCKVISVDTPDGKLTPEAIRAEHWGVGEVHHSQPRAVLITQSTELGTVYSPDELAALCRQAHELDMVVYLDGARIANAAAYLGCSLAQITVDVGVDAMTFGGTKNGALGAEAVLIFNEALGGKPLEFSRKQFMQLSSKMRYAASQITALLTDDLWLANAQHANSMAQRLAAGVRGLSGLTITQPVQANAVFAILPTAITRTLQESFAFYEWNQATGEVRWMCAWDTTEAEVDAFCAAVATALA